MLDANFGEFSFDVVSDPKTPVHTRAKRLCVIEPYRAHTTSAQEQPCQRRNHRGEHHGGDDRGPKRDGDRRRPYPEGLLVDRQMAAFAEGPRDHQGGKQSGREQPQHCGRPWGELSAPCQYRPGSLDGGASQRDGHNRDPHRAHEDSPLKPNSAAPLAASTGTPGGATGTRAAARTAAITAAVVARLPLPPSPLISRTKKK